MDFGAAGEQQKILVLTKRPVHSIDTFKSTPTHADKEMDLKTRGLPSGIIANNGRPEHAVEIEKLGILQRASSFGTISAWRSDRSIFNRRSILLFFCPTSVNFASSVSVATSAVINI